MAMRTLSIAPSVIYCAATIMGMSCWTMYMMPMMSMQMAIGMPVAIRERSPPTNKLSMVSFLLEEITANGAMSTA